MLKNKYTYILLIVNVVFTLFTYRTVLNGNLIGEPFDSRLMIVLHEHWWRWFNGLTELRDTEFFYPYDKAFGFSDVFLIQGFIYSAFRLLGLGLANSWSSTTLLLIILGNAGWVLISNKFFQSKIIRILFLLAMISSMSFVSYFTFNPNVVGYSFLSWFFTLYLSITNEKNLEKKGSKVALFIVFFLIYALSCWYGAFFLGLVLFLRYVVHIFNLVLSNRGTARNRLFLNIFSKKLIKFLPIQIFLIWIFYYIYVSVADQPDRPNTDLFRNAPKINLLANGGTPLKTKSLIPIFEKIYQQFGLDKTDEYTIGLGILVPLFGICISIFFLVKNRLDKTSLWVITFSLGYLFFINIANNYSLHRIFFENIYGFNSIRFPGRYTILLGYALIFITFIFFDKLLYSSNYKLISIFVVFLSLLLVLEQQKTAYVGWSKDLLFNKDLMSQKDEIKKKCDYFYYDFPGGWWFDQIEAITFSAQIGVPTVNGYTGAFPVGYPTESFTSNDEPLKIFDWISKIDPQKRGCFVTGRSEIKSLSREFDSIDFTGFTELETNGIVSWRWSVSPNPYLYVLSNSFQIKKINFTLNTSQCSPIQEISILDGQGKTLVPTRNVTDSSSFNFDLDMRNSVVKRVQIISDSGGCQLGKDPRKLFFEIKDFKVKSN